MDDDQMVASLSTALQQLMPTVYKVTGRLCPIKSESLKNGLQQWKQLQKSINSSLLFYSKVDIT